MASKSLGTLTLDLIAKVGGFTGPLDQASRQAKNKTSEISQSFANLAKGIGVAIAGVPAILAGVVTHTVSAAKEVSNLAQLAGLSTTEFQKYAAGAKSVGIEQDKLADILKDTNDKVGDFFNTGGGALKDFFDVIAPKVGVTAEQFKKLNSAEALQLYVSSLEKANASQAEMTFYMEAIASDSTALIPLLKNGGKQFKELGDAAEAAGAILDVKTIAVSKELSSELVELSQNLEGAKNTVVEGVMPVVAKFVKDLNDTTKSAGGLNTKVSELGETLLETSAFVVNAGDGVVRVFRIVSETLVGMYSTAAFHMAKLMAGGAEWLSKVTYGDTSKGFLEDSKRLSGEAAIYFGVAEQAAASLKEQIETPLAGERLREYWVQAKKDAADIAKLAEESKTAGTGSGADPAALEKAKKAAEAAAAAQKKLNDQVDDAATEYSRQIALINTSTDAQKNATEVDKLRFEIASGKMKGINADQQKRLLGLAAELDSLEKLKKANEDQAKAESYIATLRQANNTVRNGMDQELAGAGLGDKAKDRMRQDLQIQQDFNQQMADLQEQYNSKQISPELYALETEALGEALAERLVMQQDYYNQLDEAQANWMDGVSSAWENYRDAAMDYQQQASDFVSGSLSDLTTGMGDMFSSVIQGQKTAGEALADFASNMASSIIGALADMAAQWLVYQAVQLLVGKAGASAAALGMIANAEAMSIQASLNAYASTAAIPIYGPALAPAAAATAAASTAPMVASVATAALAGMAHDGIDSVPADGTWYLQKGERVTTAETSAKLDRTLDRVQAGSGAGGRVTIHAPVTVQAQPGMSDEDARRQGDMMGEGLRQTIRQVVNEEFSQGGSMWRR